MDRRLAMRFGLGGFALRHAQPEMVYPKESTHARTHAQAAVERIAHASVLF